MQPAVAGGVRNFGSWLDDASIMTPGSGSLTDVDGLVSLDRPTMNSTRRSAMAPSV